MFNIQLLLLFLIYVTTASTDENQTRPRDPRLTVINIYSGLEEVNDLNKNRSATLFMSDDDDDDDDNDDDNDDAGNDDNAEHFYEDDDDADDDLPVKGKHHHSGQMQNLDQDNQLTDRDRSKEFRAHKKKSKLKSSSLKHHKQKSKIFYSNADATKSDSSEDKEKDSNTNGLENHDLDKGKVVMNEFVTDRDGFWPKTYNWNSFRKVIQLINEISY